MHVNGTNPSVQYILPCFQIGFHLYDFILGLYNLRVDFSLPASNTLESCIGCIQVGLDLFQLGTHILNDLLPVFLLQTGGINLALQVLHLVVQIIGIGRHVHGLST